MDKYNKAEQFLKHPFNFYRGLNTVSKWTPQDYTAKATEKGGCTQEKNDFDRGMLLEGCIRPLDTTSAYKNIIRHFPSPDTSSDHIYKWTTDQFINGRAEDGLDRRESPACDVILPDHELGMTVRCHGERGIRPYVLNINQHDVITTESDESIRLMGVDLDTEQYQDLDLLPLNLGDSRMPIANRHQVKGYYIVNRE